MCHVTDDVGGKAEYFVVIAWVKLPSQCRVDSITVS